MLLIHRIHIRHRVSWLETEFEDVTLEKLRWELLKMRLSQTAKVPLKLIGDAVCEFWGKFPVNTILFSLPQPTSLSLLSPSLSWDGVRQAEQVPPHHPVVLGFQRKRGPAVISELFSLCICRKCLLRRSSWLSPFDSNGWSLSAAGHSRRTRGWTVESSVKVRLQLTWFTLYWDTQT